MGRRLRPWIAAVVLAVGLPGCGPAPAPDVASDVLWRTEEELEAAAARPPWVESLAQAGNAGTRPVTRDTAIREYAGSGVVLKVDGSLYARGHVWRKEAEDRRELAGVFEALGARPDLLLSIEPATRWSDVAVVLETAFEGASRRWRLAVDTLRARRARSPAEIDARVIPRWSTIATRGEVDLERVGEDLVVVRHPRGEERVAAGDPYAPAVVGSANAAWGRLRAALATARFERIELRVGDGVPWSHVVEVVAIALDVGTYEVALDRPAVVLLLSTPPKTVVPPGSRDRRDWPAWLSIGIGVGAALLLFGRRLRDPRAGAMRRRPRAA